VRQCRVGDLDGEVCGARVLGGGEEDDDVLEHRVVLGGGGVAGGAERGASRVVHGVGGGCERRSLVGSVIWLRFGSGQINYEVPALMNNSFQIEGGSVTNLKLQMFLCD